MGDWAGRLRRIGLASFLAGLCGLGAASLISGDFAFQWQPVPATLPYRELLARGAGLLLVALASASIVPKWRAAAFPVIAAYLAFWVLLTHALLVAEKPWSIPAWLGVGEIGALFLAAAAVTAALLRSARPILPAARLFGAAPIIFGIAHFAYPEITASMVPGWIPFPLFWAYATGAAHLAGGAAILAGILPVHAAALLGAMYLSWAVLLHLPRVIDAPENRVEWTMLFVALALAGAAFLVAWCFARARRFVPGQSATATL